MTTFVSLLRARFTVVWVLLVAATLLSFWLGTDHGLSSAQSRTILILVVAFVKVRLVGLYFMELRTAPGALRALFEAYCAAACVTLLSFYLLA